MPINCTCADCSGLTRNTERDYYLQIARDLYNDERTRLDNANAEEERETDFNRVRNRLRAETTRIFERDRERERDRIVLERERQRPRFHDGSNVIYAWNHKMEVNPQGEDPKNLLLGAELEVYVNTRQYNYESVAKKCAEIVGDKGLLKFDGSIYERTGFEVVTQPLSLDLHDELWKSFLLDNRVDGISEHNTCGFHVHVSRKPLSKLQIAKLVVFVNLPENREFIELMAGRKANNYNKILKKEWGYANRYYDRNQRYVAVNIINEHTIEFRMFSCSFDYDVLMRRLEFVRSLVEFCGPSVTGCQNLRHNDYIAWLHNHKRKDYPYDRLKKYLVDTVTI